MSRWYKIKQYIANRFFKDVMNSNARRYVQFNRVPTDGIKECYNVARSRLIDDIKSELSNGNFNANIVDPIFDFHVELMQYDYSSLSIGIAKEAEEVITDYESQNPTLIVNKEKLYFLFALLSTTSGNTMTSTTYWELTLKEASRISGTPVSINHIINQMPVRFTSLLNATKLRHDQNMMISALRPRYAFIYDYEANLNYLNNLSLLSFLSSGIRNVHINTLFDTFNQTVDVVKMYAQELINNLCVLNEAELKNNPHIPRLLPNQKDRMIGKMLQCLSTINPGVHAVFSTLHTIPTIKLSSETDFNNNFFNFLQIIESGTLTDDELKAYVLFGLLNLRNKVLHNLNPNLIYFNNTVLFLKTIGLLFSCISVIRSL